jgi:membrane-bound lytic murein transglycosylase F
MIFWMASIFFRSRSRRGAERSFSIYPALGLFALTLSFFLLLSVTQHRPAAVDINTQQSTQLRDPVAVRPNSALSPLAGDLDGLEQQGHLRILMQKPGLAMSPLTSTEKNLITQFASEKGLESKWIVVDDEQQLRSYLQEGLGDIVLGAKTAFTGSEDENIQLTLPWGISQQQVISRSDTGRIRNINDLGTRQVAIKRSSPVWQELKSLATINSSMALILIPESQNTEGTMQRVASAEYDVTVLDNLFVEPVLPQFLNLEVAFNLTEASTVSWGIRSTASKLQASLNGFLNEQYMRSAITRSYQEDLPALQSRKLLRLITYQSPVNYFLHAGKLKGFEHDLLRRFAENHEMRLDVVIAESHDEMRALLLAGKGDIAAASLPRMSFDDDGRLAFTEAYSHAAPVVIGRSEDSTLLDVQALKGRRVILPAASPYKGLLKKIRASGIDFDLIIADVGESSETILFHIADGMYDLSVIAGHELKAQFKRQVNLRAHFALSEPLAHSWAVREADTQLLSALNNYIAKEFRKSFYNVLYSKYIEKPVSVLGDYQLLAGVDKLSPYDDIVHKYAEHYGFDWRLIVAQMYQESQFDPNAISYAGAEGLMQLIPATADFMGITDTYDPDTSIQAGVRYMDYLRSKFDEDLLLEDRIWFSLASYNAGYNRVHRARLIAESMNLDKNKWFDNVEKAILVLARPYWKDGETKRNCRCGQTVAYVRDIRTLYSNYMRLTQSIRTVSNRTDLSQDI